MKPIRTPHDLFDEGLYGPDEGNDSLHDEWVAERDEQHQPQRDHLGRIVRNQKWCR